jgi:hypothetical protein
VLSRTKRVFIGAIVARSRRALHAAVGRAEWFARTHRGLPSLTSDWG